MDNGSSVQRNQALEGVAVEAHVSSRKNEQDVGCRVRVRELGGRFKEESHEVEGKTTGDRSRTRIPFRAGAGYGGVICTFVPHFPAAPSFSCRGSDGLVRRQATELTPAPQAPPMHRGPETGGRPAHSRGLQGRPCECRAHRAMRCRGIGDRRSQGAVPFSRVAPGTRLALCGVTAGDFARPKNSASRFRSASQVRASRLGESQSRLRQKAAVLADRRPRVVRYSVRRLVDPHVTEPPVKRYDSGPRRAER